MGSEERVSSGAPTVPAGFGIVGCADLAIESENAPLPVEELELVHVAASLAETGGMQELRLRQRIASVTRTTACLRLPFRNRSAHGLPIPGIIPRLIDKGGNTR
jgi:hypothetical protein